MEKQRSDELCEYWESTEPEVDFNELNRNNIVNRYNTTINTNINYENEKLSNVYEKLNKQDNNELFSYSKGNVQSISTNASEENPFMKFENIKREIDLIESDFEFYKKNPNFFKEKFNYSVEKAFEELKKIKSIADYVKTKENYLTLNKLYNKFGGRVLDDAKKKNMLSLLNKSLLEENSTKLLSNIKTIHEVSTTKPGISNDICYELYLTPDSSKLKIFSQVIEIQKEVENLKEQLGNFDIVSFNINNLIENKKSNIK